MNSNKITVVYKWTAKPNMLDQLKVIYANVAKAMETNEPGALAVEIFASTAENALYVRDEFADAGALAFHLGTTAAPHFPSLLEIATPGTFYFFGDVPEDTQQAVLAMGLAAEFASKVTAFDRSQTPLAA